MESRFIASAPSAQNLVDIFEGEWSSSMPKDSGLVSTGTVPLFEDHRIKWMRDTFGTVTDWNILELGPLEGAHSYMLQQFGAANILSIESNKRAFLKCLCVKTIFNLDRVDFQLGNFLPYLETCKQQFDLILASGVLYHMTDPLRLLDMLAQRTDRLFIWTHYYDANVLKEQKEVVFGPLEMLGSKGSEYRAVRRTYPDAALAWQGFSGGANNYAMWLTRESLLRVLEDHGYKVSLSFEQPNHPNGPALALCANR